MDDEDLRALAMRLYIAYYDDASEASWNNARQVERDRWLVVAVEAIEPAHADPDRPGR